MSGKPSSVKMAEKGVAFPPPFSKGGAGGIFPTKRACDEVEATTQNPPKSPFVKGGLRGHLYLAVLTAALVLLVSACSTVPFKQTELVPVPESSSAALADGLWTRQVGKVLIRQSALFELMGMKFPVTGVMKLDAPAGTARLVGMNDMGVKLYDISIDRTASQANYIMPELSRYPGFADAVAVSVRRIFLEPAPAASDLLVRKDDSYQLTRQGNDGKTSFIFGGADHQLLEKSHSGKEIWHVRYYQYGRLNDMLVPGGIVLDDDRAGYRLTLWTESVEKSDE